MRTSRQILYLTQEDVIASGGLEMAETIRVVEQAFRMVSEGQAVEPLMPSVPFDMGEGQSLAAHLGALGGDVQKAAVKCAASNPANPTRRNIPRASVLLLLIDPITSIPLAMMDGTIINATTTGAVSGVAAKHLAREDSEVMGALGLGVIARTQITAIHEILKGIKLVKVYDPNTERAKAFASEMGEQLSLPFEVMGSAKEAVVDSDVVAVATAGVGPSDSYVEADWIKEGSLFSQMSPYDAKLEVIGSADKFVLDTLQQLKSDDRGLGMFRAQGLLKREDILDLADIVAGKLVGRDTEKERIFFKSWGLVVNDVNEGNRIYQRAKENGIGQVLELWHAPHWV